MKPWRIILKVFAFAVAVVIGAGYSGKVVLAGSAEWMQSAQLASDIIRPDAAAGDVNRSKVYNGYQKPEGVPKTCGWDPVGALTEHYYFGFVRSDGFCQTQDFVANSQNEAWMCARAYCQNCGTVEDITSQYKESVRIFGDSALNNYCPLR